MNYIVYLSILFLCFFIVNFMTFFGKYLFKNSIIANQLAIIYFFMLFSFRKLRILTFRMRVLFCIVFTIIESLCIVFITSFLVNFGFYSFFAISMYIFFLIAGLTLFFVMYTFYKRYWKLIIHVFTVMKLKRIVNRIEVKEKRNLLKSPYFWIGFISTSILWVILVWS
jgi:hypothetical protein